MLAAFHPMVMLATVASFPGFSSLMYKKNYVLPECADYGRGGGGGSLPECAGYAYQSVQAMAGGGSLPECAGYGRGRQPTRVCRLWQGGAAYQSMQAMAGGGSLPECTGYGRGR